MGSGTAWLAARAPGRARTRWPWRSLPPGRRRAPPPASSPPEGRLPAAVSARHRRLFPRSPARSLGDRGRARGARRSRAGRLPLRAPPHGQRLPPPRPLRARSRRRVAAQTPARPLLLADLRLHQGPHAASSPPPPSRAPAVQSAVGATTPTHCWSSRRSSTASDIFQLGDNGVLTADQQAHRPHRLEAETRAGCRPPARRSPPTPSTRRSSPAATPAAPGRLVALNSSTGALRWFRNLPSPAASPLR